MKVSEALDKSLFWDVNPEKLDWEKNKQFIIERVFVRGGMNPVVEIFRKYSLQEIINAVKKNRKIIAIANNIQHNQQHTT